MVGTKRTRSGEVKPTQQAPEDPPAADPTPPCGQPQKSSSTSTKSQNIPPNNPTPSLSSIPQNNASSSPSHRPTKSKSQSRKQKRQERQKAPKLPNNVSITRRPLLHPALPTPFASSSSPKILYITASSPFIPALKRVRKLLAEIEKREKQSDGATSKGKRGAQANGRLKSGDVERGVADGVVSSGEKERECVYLKATGRAIPRALELGVQFQEEDAVVRVEMGSVQAIDDIEVKSRKEGEEDEEEEDLPETRIRTISSVTVSIRAK